MTGISDNELFFRMLEYSNQALPDKEIASKLGISIGKLQKIYRIHDYKKPLVCKLTTDQQDKLVLLFNLGVQKKFLCEHFNITFGTVQKVLERRGIKDPIRIDINKVNIIVEPGALINTVY